MLFKSKYEEEVKIIIIEKKLNCTPRQFRKNFKEYISTHDLFIELPIKIPSITTEFLLFLWQNSDLYKKESFMFEQIKLAECVRKIKEIVESEDKDIIQFWHQNENCSINYGIYGACEYLLKHSTIEKHKETYNWLIDNRYGVSPFLRCVEENKQIK